MRMKIAAVFSLALLIGVSCGTDQKNPVEEETPDSQLAAPAGSLSIFAAVSLTEAFEEIGKAYEKKNPGAKVSFNFAGSSSLASQLEQGAKADIFASADEVTMQSLNEKGLISDRPRVFAKNTMQILVAKGNPKNIKTVTDLARKDLVVVLADPAVPAGRYAQEVLNKASVKVTPKSLELDVRAVVAKIDLGEADAGIVYTTDIKSSSKVAGVKIPLEHNVQARYPIAVLKTSLDIKGSEKFVGYLLSVNGQAILKKHGFDTT
ncbi:MAG TPA: molybdate ABC transporter substrate-binding protein [Actinomycetota bacterium]|nr:molybdate ABC transporter substrate-binding protein [Actinomycetota bacterium]